MELRHITWAWETVVVRLHAEQPLVGAPLRRSCRPIAAERRLDGKLTLVIGCWWPGDLEVLGDAEAQEALDSTLGPMLEDDLATIVVPWPAGMASGPADGIDIQAPNLLQGVPPEARIEAEPCESPLQRWFYAHAYARGLRLQCQQVVDHYRVDFALPQYRVAVEVDGWETRMAPRERERGLGDQRWRVLWFPGQEVHKDADGCASSLMRALPPGAGVRAAQEPTLGRRRPGNGNARWRTRI